MTSSSNQDRSNPGADTQNQSSRNSCISLRNSVSIHIVSSPVNQQKTDTPKDKISRFSLYTSVKAFSSEQSDLPPLPLPHLSELSCNESPAKTLGKNPCRSSSISNDFLKDEDQSEEVLGILRQVRNEAQRKLKISRLFVIGNLCSNILGLLTFKGITDFQALAIIILGFMLLIAIYSFWKKAEEQKRITKIFWIAHLISFGIFLIIAILQYKQIISLMWFGVIPGFITLFFEIIMRQTKLFVLFVKIIIWVQLLLISLEIDKVIQLPWCVTIIILNAIAVLCLICILLILMLWISALLGSSYSATKGKTAIIGSTWHLLLILSTITWAVDIISFQNLIGIPLDEDNFWEISICGASYCLLLLGFTIIYNKELLSFLKEQAFSQMKDTDIVQQLEIKTIFLLEPPKEKYLVKLSSSYFALPNSYGGLLTPKASSNHRMTQENVSVHINHIQGKKTPKANHTIIEENRLETFENWTEDEILNLKPPMRSLILEDYTKEEDKVNPDRNNQAIRTKSIHEKKENEDNKRSCVICFAKEANVVIMNCGHGGMCCECATLSWKTNDTCHICRGNVECLVRIMYLPELDVYKVMDRIVKKKERRQFIF